MSTQTGHALCYTVKFKLATCIFSHLLVNYLAQLIQSWLRCSCLSWWQAHLCHYIQPCSSVPSGQSECRWDISALDLSHLEPCEQASYGTSSHVWNPAVFPSYSQAGHWFNKKPLRNSTLFQQFIWCLWVNYAHAWHHAVTFIAVDVLLLLHIWQQAQH